VTVDWSGQCIDGMASGKVVATYSKEGSKMVNTEAEYKEGIPNGYGTML